MANNHQSNTQVGSSNSAWRAGILAWLFGLCSFAQAADTSVELFDPAFGITFALGKAGEVSAPLEMNRVGVRASVAPSQGISNTRLVGLKDNPEACGKVRINHRAFPAEFLVPHPSAEAVCRYRIHYWRPGWAWAGRDDFSIAWTSHARFANVEAVIEPAENEEAAPSVALASDEGFGEMSADAARVTVGSTGGTEYTMGPPQEKHGRHGNRVYCPVSHFSYDDPIVYPDQPGAAHLHMFWGNTEANAFTRGTSIRDAMSSSCEGGTENLSSSWAPALFNEQGEVVLPEAVFTYYKSFGVPNDRYDLLQVVPEGLEMLASSQTKNFNRWVTLGHHWREKDGQRTELRFGLSFPSCVATYDGSRTGTPILRYQDMPGEASEVVNSHVAYPGGPDRNEVGCPASHPYRFAGVSFILKYDAKHTGDNPYLASDAMMGAEPLGSAHADYIAGLSPEANAGILQCIQESRSCGFEGNRGQLPERLYAPSGAQIYRNSVRLEDSVDRTPFGNHFKPMLSHGHHHH